MSVSNLKKSVKSESNFYEINLKVLLLFDHEIFIGFLTFSEKLEEIGDPVYMLFML